MFSVSVVRGIFGGVRWTPWSYGQDVSRFVFLFWKGGRGGGGRKIGREEGEIGREEGEDRRGKIGMEEGAR